MIFLTEPNMFHLCVLTLITTLAAFPDFPHFVASIFGIVAISSTIESNIENMTEYQAITRNGRFPYISDFLMCSNSVSWGLYFRYYIYLMMMLHRFLKTGFQDLHMLILAFCIGMSDHLLQPYFHATATVLFMLCGTRYAHTRGKCFCWAFILNLIVFIAIWIYEWGSPSYWSAMAEWPLLGFISVF